ncbi:hypothetical protein DDB_G0269266 [Dictyostelium discoideum AX4]|uniref:Reverse transcriptase domain-containing protein n=1 Tax=Dictyostelium discoideum TaxID=44689 RepID=Q55EE8_DICDI|nr:hypothetical protein DDB_G0269266 [Dictyostelium discoideum AX4]EAL71983.1 hypothetical protein DDB_G0269266 [Dictyostelium discoideum AX4]|eukprot:XP_645833.1 hypothetical protein DDB_G0269266 [Dictyostelium discoideum AX4]
MFNYERIDHGNGKGTGVSIENRNLSTGYLTVNFKDTEGRILSVKFNSYININILLIYAPASIPRRNAFIIAAKNLIKDQKIKHDIIAGDFNADHNNNSHYGIGIRSIIEESNLKDIGANNNIATFSRSNSRLDRIYCKPTMVGSNPLRVHEDIYNKSDHTPISIDLKMNNNSANDININNIKIEKLPWTLCKETLADPTIHEEISQIIENNKQYINTLDDWIHFKNYTIRHHLKKQQNLIKKEKNKKKSRLHRLIEREDLYPGQRKQLEDEMEELLKEEEANKQWETKLKLHLNQETPSRYLTSKLKKRKKDRSIFQIKNKDGTIVSEKVEIAKCFLEFYQEQYDEKPDNESKHKELLDKWIVDKQYISRLSLDSAITPKEVNNAIKNSNPHKSPGLDGINAALYRNHSASLSTILAKVFNDTLTNQKEINPNFKEGFITTLFKKGDELQIANRRPITLLNTDYKLLSKIINNRLLAVTKKIINKFQNGFVPNRYIQDNIQIMKEVIERANKSRNSTTLITFFDFNKAFDSISHKSIRRTLSHIGIPKTIVELIMNLLKETTNKIKINDFLVGHITVNRGTKQGDPLSPTIFALVMEALLIDILKEIEIKGFKLSDQKRIKLTAFADDMSTFNNSAEELKLVLDKINNYCLGTSSKLNQEKTVMICIGNIPPNLPFKISEAPERYLGLNFTKVGLNSKITSIINSIKDSLNNWKSQATTIRAKMTIVKTYALSRLSYHQYLDSLNESHITELNNIIKWFLFSAIKNTYTEEHKYRTLMTMDRAYGDWKEGGIKMWDLGIRQVAFKVWNMNRLLHIIKIKACNILQEWYMEQISNSKYISIGLREMVDRWKDFRNNFAPQHNKLKSLPDCIKGQNKKPLQLKEIYNMLITHKYKSIRKTDGQKNLISINNINIPSIFQHINHISHQKGRNTLFRFFSRSLPGINYERNVPCKICNNIIRDPYTHLFIDCMQVKEIENIIISTFNNLSFFKIRNWDLNSLDISKTNKKERIYPNLIGIIIHQLWRIICHKLFNQDESKTPPSFDPTLIEKELTNLIKIEKFILIKKIERSETIYKLNNRDQLIINFNTSWHNPNTPNPIPL